MAFLTAIGTAVAGVLFTAGTTAFTIAASLVTGALSFGLNLALTYLNRPKARTYSAVQGEQQFGADSYVSTVYGIAAVAGHRVEYFKYGPGNKYNSHVIILATGWCDGLEPEIIFYGEKHNLIAQPVTGNEVESWLVEGFSNKIKIRFYDGRPGQLADSQLIAATSNVPVAGANDDESLSNPWAVTDTVDNHAYVVVDEEYEAQYFEKGRLEYLFVLRGLREYDPRFDDTYPGGSGSQRLADPSTWVHTENPAIHRLNYRLGVRGLISGRALIGMGESLGQIHVASHIAAANVCDTPRVVGGVSKKTYACSLFVSAADDHSQVLKEFEDAMAGYLVNFSGLSGVVPGAPQIPVLDIGVDDIRADAPKSLRWRKSSYDQYNHFSGNYTSKELLWGSAPLAVVSVNADIAADRSLRSTENDFLQVTDPDIGQYLLHIRYRQNRLGAKATLPVSARVGFRVNVGDWVTYLGREWMVVNHSISKALRVTLKLSEVSADVYSEAGIDAGPILPVYVPVRNPSLASTVYNFSVTAGEIAGEVGSSQPALFFAWNSPNDPSMTGLRVEYWDSLAPELVLQHLFADVEAGAGVVTAGIEGGRTYVARALPVTFPDRFRAYTDNQATQSQTPRRGLSVDAVDLQASVAQAFATTLDLRKLGADVQQLAHDSLHMGLEYRHEIDQVSASVAGAFASVKNERFVRATETEALALNIATVTGALASVENATAINGIAISTLSQNQTQIGVDLTSLGQSIVQINNDLSDMDGEIVAAADAVSELQTEVGQKNSVFRQDDAPALLGRAEGDLWIDTDDAFKLYVFTAGGWVDSSTAGMTVFNQDAPPITGVDGALWVDSDNGNLLHRWDEGQQAWEPVDDQRISALATSLTAVEATANGATAAGLFKIEAVAAQNVEVRLSTFLRVTTADDFLEAGEYSEIVSDGNGGFISRKVFVFDRVEFVNEADPVNGLRISNGQIIAGDGAIVIDGTGISGFDNA